MEKDVILLEVRPSWWRFFWHFFFFWLLIPLIVALWRRLSFVLRINSDRVYIEKGLLSKETKEIYILDIRTIDTKQSLLQRVVGIGDIKIATAGTGSYEAIGLGLPRPNKIKAIINRQRGEISRIQKNLEQSV